MPSTELLVLILIVTLGLGFDFINGFHDTANAIATSVATRVLSPGQAVLLAAGMNVVGAMSGTAVASTVGKGIIPTEVASQQLVVAALLSAITWNLVTWWFGIPSSSSHALVFSIVGAGTASAGLDTIKVDGVAKVLKGMAYSPLLGFLGAFLILFGLLWLMAKRRPRIVDRVFGRLQIVSAAFMAFSHGSNDAQKTMGVISLALASYYGWSGDEWNVPVWVILSAAAAMGLGTATGGWRIVRTMGLKVVQLRPIDGFAAETAAASVIEVASRLGIPVSTTHVISSAIMGVGATKRASAVRWGVAGRIVSAWVVTIPVCVTLGWLFYQALHVVTRGGLGERMSNEALRGQRTVVVVEDDESLLKVIAYTLRRAGYQVLEAGDGVAGFEAARRAGPDLMAVVLDRMLPGRDGLHVLRQLRADPTTRDAGVVMISASTDDETRAAALAGGADAFVGKPFRLEDLLHQIRTAQTNRHDP